MAYDANGNVETMTYPGGVVATYSYDLADRPTGLSVTTPANPTPQTVASGGTYRPAGPLTGLSLGNGTTEARDYTPRYFPKTITWSGGADRTWTYATDAVGNITSISGTQTCDGDVTVHDTSLSGSEPVESCADLVLGPNLTVDATADIAFRAAGSVRIADGFAVASGASISIAANATVTLPPELRLFEYQDGPYFLTRGDGPWGERDWTYDRIGNRVTEQRHRSGTSETDTYHYDTNGTGDTALLRQVVLAPTGTADYDWDNAGNFESLDRGANHIAATFDAASRLARLERNDGMDPATVYAAADILYDGRGYLRSATDSATGAIVEPLYDSAGLLHALVEKDAPAAPERRHTLFYLAGRPVAQLTQDAGTDTWTYLTTDHLGTPLLASDATGGVTWSGGFEPFGHDYAEGTAEAALDAGVFLRFPGQWETELWADAALGSGGVYYNVYRWYLTQTGRYASVDPLGLGAGGRYSYGGGNPIVLIDPLGLKVELYCHPIGAGGDDGVRRAAGRAGFQHCFVRVKCDCDPGGSYDLRLEVTGRNEKTGMAEIPANPPSFNYGHNASIVPFSPADWTNDDCSTEKCILDKYHELRTKGVPYGEPPLGWMFGPNSNSFAERLLKSCKVESIYWPEGVTGVAANDD